MFPCLGWQCRGPYGAQIRMLVCQGEAAMSLGFSDVFWLIQAQGAVPEQQGRHNQRIGKQQPLGQLFHQGFPAAMNEMGCQCFWGPWGLRATPQWEKSQGETTHKAIPQKMCLPTGATLFAHGAFWALYHQPFPFVTPPAEMGWSSLALLHPSPPLFIHLSSLF